MGEIRLGMYVPPSGNGSTDYSVALSDDHHIRGKDLEPLGPVVKHVWSEDVRNVVERPFSDVLRIAEERGATIVAEPVSRRRHLKDRYLLFREKVG